MATNLQDYSIDNLSPEFIKVFATKNFSHIIEKWVLDTSKNVLLLVVALAKESKARGSTNSTQMITSFLTDNIFLLSEQIMNECERKASSLAQITQNDIDFLVFEYDRTLVFETLCIYDWIHEYSVNKFHFENDNSVIHLLFKVSQRDTFCECSLMPNAMTDFPRISERSLTLRLETPKSFEGPEPYFKTWSRLLSFLNDPHIGQRWNRYLLNQEN